MPFWKREEPARPSSSAPPPPPPPPPPVVARVPAPGVQGSLPCSEHGCQRHDAVACAYVDRRRRPCPTAWCPDHQILVSGLPHCRRHARITASAASDEFQGGQALPDLENRSPSLADYVGDALEPRILAFLVGLRRPGSYDQVAAEPVHVIHPTAGGARRWDRTWKLYDHTGVQAKVSVEVDESRDPEVLVRVGRHVVSQAVPPWIERRRQGLPPLAPSDDSAQRERFYAALWEPAIGPLLADLEESRGLPSGSLPR